MSIEQLIILLLNCVIQIIENKRFFVSFFGMNDNFYFEWIGLIKDWFAKHYFFYVLFYTLCWELGVKRCLVFYDMYTDALVIRELYTKELTILFMLSSMFFITPFLASWAVALRIFSGDFMAGSNKRFI